ncbi:MAG TPA: serine/threonine-protein kinase [Pirellulaceae bacterium]|nr:serine/threonine-protein kinase [Pirellulaceae bacterium]
MNEREQAILDRLAFEFESAWRRGETPAIEMFLDRVPKHLRLPLARLLFPIEINCRMQAGQVAELSLWQNLGQEFAAIVAEVLLDRTITAPSGPADASAAGEFDVSTWQIRDSSGPDAIDPTMDATYEKRSSLPRTRQGSDRQIGPYKLLHRLGAGGMGEVWVAEQSEPVRRQVALKLIKEGIGTKEIIARFEAERQALALMSHPNIARILDAGSTREGQPFFVMELVTGQPLTTYCDENKLSIDDRLQLFMDVCSGVQHAHQKGIIHRDLKPGNIIVGMQDGIPVPKIIDFGLAKAMESSLRLTDQSLFTGIGQILGTLKYMSPEQAGLDLRDIDTRADIYALGVILYELLTGSTPLDETSIKGQAILKVLELIRDKEPVKPSRRLGSSTDEQISSITGQRQTDSVRLRRILLGDLDWIVMKALDKDRMLRYESASEFAADIRRFLNSEPVTARPPSHTYRIRKFVRKNQLAVAAASLLAIALTLGILGTAIGLREARQQQWRAENELKEKNIALELAERRLEQLDQGNELLGSVFANLSPYDVINQELPLQELLVTSLQLAGQKLLSSEIGDALTMIRLRLRLGRSLYGLASPGNAVTLLDSAYRLSLQEFGEPHAITTEVLGWLVKAHDANGELVRALELQELVLLQQTALHGEQHLMTLAAEAMYADLLEKQGDFDLAIERLRQVTKSMQEFNYQDSFEFNQAMGMLAKAYARRDSMVEAIDIQRQVVDTCLNLHGEDAKPTLIAKSNLATFLLSSRQVEEALAILRSVLQTRTRQYGSGHVDTLVAANSLANALLEIGRVEEGMAMCREVVSGLTERLGSAHSLTVSAQLVLGSALMQYGDLDEAIPMLEQTLRLRLEQYGADHEETARTQNALGLAYKRAGRLDEAIPLLENALDVNRKLYPQGHRIIRIAAANLASTYLPLGRAKEGIPYLEEFLDGQREMLSARPQTLVEMLETTADELAAFREFQHAAKLYAEAWMYRKAAGQTLEDLLITSLFLAWTLERSGDYQQSWDILNPHLDELRVQVTRELETVGPAFLVTLDLALAAAKLLQEKVNIEALISEREETRLALAATKPGIAELEASLNDSESDHVKTWESLRNAYIGFDERTAFFYMDNILQFKPMDSGSMRMLLQRTDSTIPLKQAIGFLIIAEQYSEYKYINAA